MLSSTSSAGRSTPEKDQRRLLVLVGSPRRDGNSAVLASAVEEGARDAGLRPVLRFLDDHIANFLNDCRRCRRDDGQCALNDGFRELFLNDFLPAEGVVLCSPIYWYGFSAQIKAFFDRSFCYYAASYPASDAVLAKMAGKRLGLVMSSEETYPGAGFALVHALQEYARYTRSELVGVVRGIGNRRGEVVNDPQAPVEAARSLGREIFRRAYSDYRLDTKRSTGVWPALPSSAQG